MPMSAEKVLSRKIVRVRERNQITLPAEIISGLPIHAGDFLEISRTEDGLIFLKPTVIVTVGSQEAHHQEALANEDITNRRYRTFSDAEEFLDDVKSKRRNKERKVAAAASQITS